MNGKQIRISNDIYSDIENIRKKLIDKAGLHKNLTIRETMDIIWNAKDHNGLSLEEAILKIKESNIKIAWGSRRRGSKKHRKGTMHVDMTPLNSVTQVNK
jgi:ribosomal protein L21